MVDLRHKGNKSVNAQPKLRHCFPQSLSPGNGGKTGITVETTLQKKNNPADGGSKEGEEGE